MTASRPKQIQNLYHSMAKMGGALCQHGARPRWLPRAPQFLRSSSPRAGTLFAEPETEPLTFAAPILCVHPGWPMLTTI